MIGERRSRRWLVFVGAAVLSMGGMAVSLATRSVAGVVVVIAFTAVFGIVWIGEIALARRRGVVPGHLQGLDRDQQRLVSATVNSGALCPDPGLAGVVVAHARIQQRFTVLFLLTIAIGVALRLASLPSAHGAEQFAHVSLLALLLIAAVFAVRAFIRARRAAALNAGGSAA
jgi:hypothetical protein